MRLVLSCWVPGRPKTKGSLTMIAAGAFLLLMGPQG